MTPADVERLRDQGRERAEQIIAEHGAPPPEFLRRIADHLRSIQPAPEREAS